MFSHVLTFLVSKLSKENCILLFKEFNFLHVICTAGSWNKTISIWQLKERTELGRLALLSYGDIHTAISYQLLSDFINKRVNFLNFAMCTEGVSHNPSQTHTHTHTHQVSSSCGTYLIKNSKLKGTRYHCLSSGNITILKNWGYKCHTRKVQKHE